MKFLLALALLTSVSAFADNHEAKHDVAPEKKDAKKEAKAACHAEGKSKKEMNACVKEKMAAPAAEAKMETAPAAAAPATK